MTPMLAFLLLDGQQRQTCVGCSGNLYELGMLDKVMEFSIGEQQPEFSVVFYEIARGFTLADCQKIAKDHVGGKWGA